MGSKHRGKGQSSSHHRRQSSTISDTSPEDSNSESPTSDPKDFDLVATSSSRFAEGRLLRMSTLEILCIIAGIVTVMTLSLMAAVVAEMSISVHYYGRPGAASFEVLDREERQLNLYDRVTMLDSEIVAMNWLLDGNGLHRVIQRSPLGHARTLLVVEEKSQAGESTNKTGSVSLKFPHADYYDLATVRGKLCPDHHTVGFDNWHDLKRAIMEANTLSVERFVIWSRFFAEAESFKGIFENNSLYYEEDIILEICPGARLRARKGPIFVNAPNIMLTCEGCSIEVGGSHLSFGAHAKNVLVKGITFRRARTSSLVFYHSGADVSFEDCSWVDNLSVSTRFGAVADVNSTSNVNFYRCHIGNTQRGDSPGHVSSLSVRN